MDLSQLPPGLAGYVQAQQANQQQGTQQLQQLGLLQQLMAAGQKQARDNEDLQRNEALRAEIMKLPPEQRTRENVLPLVMQYLHPKEIIPLLKEKPEKTATPTKLSQLIAEKAALPEGDPQHATYADAIIKESQTAKQVVPPTAEPAVTPVTIQDPKDPNGTLVIDGRTQRVLGKGPKLSQLGGADLKLRLAAPQAKLRVESITQNLDRLDTAISELHDDPGLPNITGSVMGRTPNLTNTATGAQAKLDSIKSQIFVSSLQAMREASKTGGAVGNVSDREGDKLERTLAALDQAQGTDRFKGELKKAQTQLRLSKELIHNAYEEQYGGVAAAAAPEAAKPPSPPAPGGRRIVDW
jgi:hypothetical protein